MACIRLVRRLALYVQWYGSHQKSSVLHDRPPSRHGYYPHRPRYIPAKCWSRDQTLLRGVAQQQTRRRSNLAGSMRPNLLLYRCRIRLFHLLRFLQQQIRQCCPGRSHHRMLELPIRGLGGLFSVRRHRVCSCEVCAGILETRDLNGRYHREHFEIRDFVVQRASKQASKQA